MKQRSAFRFFKDRDGAAIVEFALVAPLLVFLICGMAEFANAMRQYHVMEKGVRDAGRYLARVPMTGCAVNASAATAARNLAVTGRTSGGTALLPNWADANTVVVSVAECFDNSAATYRGHTQMPIIQVQASAPYVDLGLLTIIGVGAINLQATHQQIWIGE
jgi:Flp pilus assembly protein TadG